VPIALSFEILFSRKSLPNGKEGDERCHQEPVSKGSIVGLNPLQVCFLIIFMFPFKSPYTMIIFNCLVNYLFLNAFRKGSNSHGI